MNFNLIQTLTSRIPGILSGVPTFSQISSETAISIENFNSELTAWRRCAESWQRQAAFLGDVAWMLEHTADEIFNMAHSLKVDRYKLTRELLKINLQRAVIADAMQMDLTAAQADAEKKHTAAVTLAEKQLSKILSRDNQREHAQFDMAVRQSDAVKSTQAAITDIRGHLSALTELRRPLDDNDVKLREMLVESVRDLIK